MQYLMLNPRRCGKTLAVAIWLAAFFFVAILGTALHGQTFNDDCGRKPTPTPDPWHNCPVVPEPATTGFVIVGGSMAAVAWIKRKRAKTP